MSGTIKQRPVVFAALVLGLSSQLLLANADCAVEECSFGAGGCINSVNFCRAYQNDGTCPSGFTDCDATTATTTTTKTTVTVTTATDTTKTGTIDYGTFWCPVACTNTPLPCQDADGERGGGLETYKNRCYPPDPVNDNCRVNEIDCRDETTTTTTTMEEDLMCTECSLGSGPCKNSAGFCRVGVDGGTDVCTEGYTRCADTTTTTTFTTNTATTATTTTTTSATVDYGDFECPVECANTPLPCQDTNADRRGGI
eukprot:gene3630-6194_t